MLAGVGCNWFKDGSVMVYVPAGEFRMGSAAGEGDDDDHPQRKVFLDAFWIDKTEVTNEQYGKSREWMKKSNDHSKCFKGEPANKDHTPSYWTDSKWNGAKQRVVGVDWYDAYAYAAWAGKGLPTEVEWEKAARGADGRKYPWGNDWDGQNCNAQNRRGTVVEVGSFPDGKSPYGCLDMAGNAWEGCANWYESSHYRNGPARNPLGPNSGSSRVLRGGSWYYGPPYCRVALRNDFPPFLRRYYYGFRCACVR